MIPDYIFLVFFFPLCLAGLLFAIPWILKQRRMWNHSAKGNAKVLILRGFTVEKVVNQGLELLLPYRNSSVEWIAFLDAANPVETV